MEIDSDTGGKVQFKEELSASPDIAVLAAVGQRGYPKFDGLKTVRDELYRKLQIHRNNRVRYCRRRFKDFISLSPTATDTIHKTFRYSITGKPYFKDKDGFPAPAIYNKYASLLEPMLLDRSVPEEDAVILACIRNFVTNFKGIHPMAQLRARSQVLDCAKTISLTGSIEQDEKLADRHTSMNDGFKDEGKAHIRAQYTTLAKWMRKYPHVDIVKAPHRGARQFRHGQASRVIKSAIENITERMQSEVQNGTIKLIRDSAEGLIQDDNLIRESAEHVIQDDELIRGSAEGVIQDDKLIKDSDEDRIEEEKLIRDSGEDIIEDEKLIKDPAENVIEEEKLTGDAADNIIEDDKRIRAFAEDVIEDDKLIRDSAEDRIEDDNLIRDSADDVIEHDRMSRVSTEDVIEVKKLIVDLAEDDSLIEHSDEDDRMSRDSAEDTIEEDSLSGDSGEDVIEDDRMSRDSPVDAIEDETLIRDSAENVMEDDRISTDSTEDVMEGATIATLYGNLKKRAAGMCTIL